jgi:hypothetical protein
MVKVFKNPSGTNLIQELLRTDTEFKEAFEYLISDMNSHPKHLFYYFKAILVNYFKKKYQLTNEILNGQSLEEFLQAFECFLELFQMNHEEKEVARKMLMPVDNIRVKGADKLDFTLLDNYFLGLYNKN